MRTSRNSRAFSIEEQEAKRSGLVVVYGYSDDLIELRGAIEEEVGLYDGGTIRLCSAGLVPEWPSDGYREVEDAVEYFRRHEMPHVNIEAKWDHDGYSWWLNTTIPHATFDILDDGEKYCRGIVFLASSLDGQRKC